jgi:hypothetical protein
MIIFRADDAHIRELMHKMVPERNWETADVVAFERLHRAELNDALASTLRRFIAAKLGAKQ